MSMYAYNSSNSVSRANLLFHGKKAYYKDITGQPEKNYIDLWYTKPLYGKVDRNFNIIHASSKYIKLVNEGAGKKDIFALNFVADAFNALRIYINQLKQRKKVVDSFYCPLKAHKGWEGVNLRYKRHLDTLYNAFVKNYISSGDKSLNHEITSFDKFLPIFKDYLNTLTDGEVAFTKSGFISKVNFPHMSSGLVIEIANERDASNDMKKLMKYYSPRASFVRYMDLAQKFGFYVDINMPWRLVANLDSPAWKQNPILKEIIDRYFPDGYTVQKVFDKYYHKTHKSDLESFKNLATQFYNSFISIEPTYTVPRSCFNQMGSRNSYRLAKKIFKRKVRRQRMTSFWRDKKYDYLFWLRFYFQVRLKEMQIGMSEHQLAHELKEMEQIWYSQGTNAAMGYVTQKTAELLEEQVGRFIALRIEGKNLLTGGETPDIIL